MGQKAMSTGKQGNYLRTRNGWLCCCCFSTRPLNDEDYPKSEMGREMKQFAENEANFRVTMSQTPLTDTCCCLASCLPVPCWWCVQVRLRYLTLNHIKPGSHWEDYQCFQGFVKDWVCGLVQPGEMGEKHCPLCCMCLEVCAFPGLATSATRLTLMRHYRLRPDESDSQLIRFNNCLVLLSNACCFLPLGCCPPFRRCYERCSPVHVCLLTSTLGCMTAQVNHEITYREGMRHVEHQPDEDLDEPLVMNNATRTVPGQASATQM